MHEYLKRLREERARIWEQAKALLDGAIAENRSLTAEESAQYDSMNADIDAKAAEIRSLEAAVARDSEIRSALVGHESVVAPEDENREDSESRTEADIIRSIMRGETRSHEFEYRNVLTTSTNAPVPDDWSMAGRIIAKARDVGPLLDPSLITLITTDHGNDIPLPTQSTWSTAALVAEGGTIGTSDPGFGRATLRAHKYSVMVPVSREMVEDASLDILGWVADQAGADVGYRVNNALTLGTGTVVPQGVVQASTASITGGTGVSGAFTVDNVIDLVYSLDPAARSVPGFALMGATSAIARLRKLQDGAGNYVWQPSLITGEPDRVLGYRVVENVHMAAVATNAISLVAGDLKSYIVRQVRSIRVEESKDFKFDTDDIYLKVVLRVDGALPQATHIKRFTGGTA